MDNTTVSPANEQLANTANESYTASSLGLNCRKISEQQRQNARELLQRLLSNEQPDLDQRFTEQEVTALMIISEHGEIDSAHRLLRLNASLDLVDRYGDTALIRVSVCLSVSFSKFKKQQI